MKKNDFKPGMPERRFIDPQTARIELRAQGEGDDQQMIVEGMPILYSVRTIIFPGFAEVIEPGAATEALQRNEAYLLWMHDHGCPMASYKNNTLSHEERTDGIFISADCSKTRWGRDGYEAIRNGAIDKMSFGFITAEQEWEEIKNPDGSILDVRHVIKMERVFDFSPVTFAAYDQTEISARSLEYLRNSRDYFKQAETTRDYKAEARSRFFIIKGIRS